MPKQAVSSDVIRFESRRAHHLHRIHIVMSLRPGDWNPLVWGIAGNRMEPVQTLDLGDSSEVMVTVTVVVPPMQPIEL